MKNELFSIGPITIYGYGLMIAIGVLAAYFSATYRAKKYDLDPDKVFDHAASGDPSGSVFVKRCAGWFCGLRRNHRRNPCRMDLL